METMLIQNFKHGLDTRRSRLTSVPGTLVTLQDCHVNEGAEVEKRKAFTRLGKLPSGCFGVQETPSSIYTFSSASTDSQLLEFELVLVAGTGYQVGDVVTVTGGIGTAATLTIATINGGGGVISATVTTGGSYTTAPSPASFVSGGHGTGAKFLLYFANPIQSSLDTTFGTGKVTFQQLLHYWKYLPFASAWSTGMPSLTGIVHSCCLGGKAYVIATFSVGNFSGLFVPASTIVYWNGKPIRAFSAGNVNGYGYLSDTSSYMAAQFYDNFIDDPPPGVTATYVAGTSIVTLGGSATFTVAVTDSNGGDLSYTTATKVLAFNTVLGYWVSGAGFTVTITVGSVDYVYGQGNVKAFTPTFCSTLARKVHTLSSSQFAGSAVTDASKWENQNAGALQVTISDLNYSASQQLLSIASYQGMMALFSPLQVQIWKVGASPTAYSQNQTLNNIGTSSPFSVAALGDFDVIFLADSGFRSLRVRDSSNNAMTVDLGSAVDSLVKSDLSVVAPSTAYAIVEPATGRYWCYLNGKIYVYSFYPIVEVVAWSVYTPVFFASGVATTFTPTKLFVFQKLVYLLDSNGYLYRYGDTYDLIQPVVEMPWLCHEHPTTQKTSVSLDLVISGKWSLYATMNLKDQSDKYPTLPPNKVLTRGSTTTPSDPDTMSVVDSTFTTNPIPFVANGTHIKLLAIGEPYATPQTLSTIAWNYTPTLHR